MLTTENHALHDDGVSLACCRRHVVRAANAVGGRHRDSEAAAPLSIRGGHRFAINILARYGTVSDLDEDGTISDDEAAAIRSLIINLPTIIDETRDVGARLAEAYNFTQDQFLANEEQRWRERHPPRRARRSPRSPAHDSPIRYEGESPTLRKRAGRVVQASGVTLAPVDDDDAGEEDPTPEGDETRPAS